MLEQIEFLGYPCKPIKSFLGDILDLFQTDALWLWSSRRVTLNEVVSKGEIQTPALGLRQLAVQCLAQCSALLPDIGWRGGG